MRRIGCELGVGFRQIGLEYERQARQAGDPKYTAAKLMKLALDGIFSFSHRPLHMLTLAGLALGTLAFIGAVLVFVQYVTDTTVLGYNPRNARGWTSLMIALLFMTGAQLFGLGVVGEYIGRIFEETKARPLFVVRDVINLPESGQTGPPPVNEREGR